MKVVLPDNSELELPAGATGLDAARAIGPKLAEQAVLVRIDGRVQDLRLPLADGDKIQLLTTRDREDPDALAVLRHSSAHLLAEAVTQLYPGVKLAIGPPIENGFYYDFDFPEPIREEDLEKIQAEIARRSRATRRSSSSRRIRTRSSSSTPRRATSPSTRRGTSPTSAAARTCRTRRRSRRSS
jgi:threonyl-tRNA synthetase